MEKIGQYINCILCGCCYSACPVASRDSRYLGPAALAKLSRFVQDPRDKRPFSNWSKVDTDGGVWGCDTVFKCNEVCPKEVRPADGIESLRRKLVIEKIKRFFRMKR
jgi:succinate dehydrogenase / fumarate reductase iron-sulfur subunit